MIRKKDRNGKKSNILWIFLCIVLAAAFVGILVVSQREDAAEAKRLEKLTEDQKVGIEDFEGAKERTAQRAEEMKAEETEEETAGVKKQEKPEKEAPKAAEAPAAAE